MRRINLAQLGFHHLAGGGVRQLVDDDDLVGQHPAREALAEERDQRLLLRPSALPPRGNSRPRSSTIFMSTPNTGLPALARIAISAGSSRPACLAFGVAVVPSGLISVMPQPWVTVTPRRSSASIKDGGTAAPP